MADLGERFEALGRTRSPDLWREVEGREPRSLPPPTTPRRAIAIVVAFAVAAAGLGVAALTFGGSEHPKRKAAAASDGRIAFSGVDGTTWNIYSIQPDGRGLSKLTRLTQEVAEDPVWSPDGVHLAYTVVQNGGSGGSDVWVMDADGSNAHALTVGEGSSWSPTWSPDGSRLAYAHSASGQADQIWTINADGSESRAFTRCDPPECGRDGSPAWSPDGSRIGFVRESGAGAITPISVFIWPVEDSGPKPEAIELDGATWAVDLAWSPDGSKLAFARPTSAGADFGLWQVDADGSHLGPLGDWPSAQSPSWSPDGRHIVFMAPIGPEHEALFVMSADGTDVRRVPGLPENASSPSWQPIALEQTVQVPHGPMSNGPIYYRLGGEGDGSPWFSVTPDGLNRQMVFGNEPMRIAQIAWSPDGTRIAYQNPVVGERGIFSANADGSGAVRLTQGANDGWPSWSPDRTRIVFASTRFDPSIGSCVPAGADFQCPTDLYVMNADGSNIFRLTSDPGPEYQPDWSPDGTRIAFVKADDAYAFTKIFSINVDGSGLRQLSSSGGGSDFAPSWSPDGTHLVFGAIRREDWGVWLVAADGSGERRILDASWVDDVVWSPAGSTIAFVGTPNAGEHSSEHGLFLLVSDGANLRLLAEAPGTGVAGDIAWQPIPATGARVEPVPSPAPSPTQEISADVADLIPIQEPPGAVSAVTYGLGSIWIASFDERGTVTRLDADTGQRLAEIDTGEVFPMWEVGGGGIAVADDAVWLAGAAGTPGESPGVHAYLVRIDPVSNQVVAQIDLHASAPADVAIDGSGVWVMSFGSGDHATMEVSRIDPATDEVVTTIPIDATYGHHLYSVGGRIVAETNETSDSTVSSTVLHIIDPVTALETATVPLDTYAQLGAGDVGSGLWEAFGDGFASLDPTTGRVIDAYQGIANTGDAMAVGAGGVWFVSPQGRALVGRFDPSAGDVDVTVHLPTGTTPIALAVSPDAIWILNYEGTLTHVVLR